MLLNKLIKFLWYIKYIYFYYKNDISVNEKLPRYFSNRFFYYMFSKYVYICECKIRNNYNFSVCDIQSKKSSDALKAE